MSIKKFLTISFSILLVLMGYFGYQHYSSNQVSILETPAAYSLTSKELSYLFLSDEKKSNSIFVDQIIEVHGTVDTVTFFNNRNTVILQGENPNTNLICEMDITEVMQSNKIKKGAKIQLKGICKGRLNDVVLLNCLFTNKSNDE